MKPCDLNVVRSCNLAGLKRYHQAIGLTGGPALLCGTTVYLLYISMPIH